MTYEQSTGRLLSSAGSLVALCYSGFSNGKNNPDLQDKIGLGPIPAGWYTLSGPENVTKSGPHGPYVLRLTPDSGNEMFGRAGFLIHGDSISSPGTASHGCIIPLRGPMTASSIAATGRKLREAIWQLANEPEEALRLEVVRGPWPLPT